MIRSSPPERRAARAGFLHGFLSVLGAVLWLARRPQLWPLAAVPPLVLGLLGTAAVALSLSGLRPAVAAWLPPADTWYGDWAVRLAASLAALIAAAAGLLVAFVLTPPVSAPALEALVRRVESEICASPRRDLGWLQETWCGLRASLAALAITGPLMFLATLAEMAMPLAALVTLPLKVMSAAVFSAYSMLDYPMTLRGIPIRRRFAFLASAARPVLGFGAACALLFWIPCGGIVLLPVGVVAGTRLFWSLLEAEPEIARRLVAPPHGAAPSDRP